MAGRPGCQGQSAKCGDLSVRQGVGFRICRRRLSRPAPRYTLSVNAGRLFARLGDPTLHPREELRDNSSFVVCLDLERGEGKLLWKLDADSPDAIFAGSPLVVDGRAYAVVRKGRPQMLTEVICFDAETKQRRWERSVSQQFPISDRVKDPRAANF